MKDFSCLDGEVTDYVILTGMSSVRKNHLDSQNFYPFSGEKKSYGIGDWWQRQLDKAEERREERQERKDKREDKRDERFETRMEKRSSKSEARKAQADTQREIAKSMNQPDTTTAALLAMGNKGVAPSSTGMSTGAKVGIAIGVVAVLGIIGYMAYKKSK